MGLATERKGAKASTVDRATIVRAFDFWAAQPTARAELARKAGEAGRRLVNDALEEMMTLSVSMFEDWYLRNCYRYDRLREVERRYARELVRGYLTDLAARKVDLDGG